MYGDFLERHVPDLTEQHIYPDKIKKIKVKLMMQVFSKKMFRFVDLLARSNGTFSTSIGERKIPQSGVHTAFVIHLMNGIADATNGTDDDRNCRRISFSDNSYHEEFITNAIRQLKNIRFVDKNTLEPVKTYVPCLPNLIDTLRGFKMLWRKLKEVGFQSFNTKNINQDPVENFFGAIRSHNFRSNKPTCYQFESIFKSLLITNLTSSNSPGTNCEDDKGRFLLTDSKCLLNGTQYLDNEEDNEDYCQRKKSLVNEPEDTMIPEESHVYSHSGGLIKLLKQKVPSVKSCLTCSKGFNNDCASNIPDNRFHIMHLKSKVIINKVLTKDISHKKIGLNCRNLLKSHLINNVFFCELHKKSLSILFRKLCVEKYFQSIETYISRILCGRLKPSKKKLTIVERTAYQAYSKTINKINRPVEFSNLKEKRKVSKTNVDLKATKLLSKSAKPSGCTSIAKKIN